MDRQDELAKTIAQINCLGVAALLRCDAEACERLKAEHQAAIAELRALKAADKAGQTP